MQQHAIPQNVTQYQFRLVGDMTLKQFLELVVGLILAYLFYASNLIFIFKWPLIILSVLFGVGLAFFPIEDRPLDQWIINFVRAIYGPTRFIWKKSDKIPRLFAFIAHPVEVVNTVTKTIKGPATAALQDEASDLSPGETKQLAALDSLFAASPPPPASAQAQTVEPVHFNPAVTVRKLKPLSGAGQPTTVFARPMKPAPSVTAAAASPVPVTSTKTESVVFTSKPSVVASAPGKGVATPLKTIKLPAAPRSPGLVVGAVVGKDGKLIENAIVELVSSDGIPQRAMKTNALGQFYTATPLGPGSYTIRVDKDGFVFSDQQMTVGETIIPPFELRATA